MKNLDRIFDLAIRGGSLILVLFFIWFGGYRAGKHTADRWWQGNTQDAPSVDGNWTGRHICHQTIISVDLDSEVQLEWLAPLPANECRQLMLPGGLLQGETV